MLIIRKNQTNNLIATVSMNKTLPNPYYLFSFQHIASKERVSFIPETITSNIRYDKFRFIESGNVNLTSSPPQVFFNYLGQYYYSIYEQLSPTNTDPALTANKLESGRAWVIVGDDNTQECFFEPYISNDEDFSQVIYVSEEEQFCISGDTTPVCPPELTGACPTFLTRYSPTNSIYFKNTGATADYLATFDSCAPSQIALDESRLFMVDGCSNYYQYDYTITSGGCFNLTFVDKWDVWASSGTTPNASPSMAIYDDNNLIIGESQQYELQSGSTLYLYNLTTSGITKWLEIGNSAQVFNVYYNTGNTQTVLSYGSASGGTGYYQLYSGSTNPQLLAQIPGTYSNAGSTIYFSGNTPIAVNVAGLQFELNFSAGTMTLLENNGIPIYYVGFGDGFGYLSNIAQKASCYTYNIAVIPPTPSPTPTMTITPSITPTLTPSITPTNTLTPTITPTNTLTPTPSSTPGLNNPSALGALWWIDFTDASTLTIGSGEVLTATDKIANIVFSADPGGPEYNATGYLGVSGDVRTNASQLKNQNGAYPNVSEYTWFGFVYDDVVSQRGGRILSAAGPTSNDVFSLMSDINDPNFVWRFQNRLIDGGAIVLDTDITYSAWTAVAMRSYNSGGDAFFEVWENGSILLSGTQVSNSVYIATDPVFALMFGGGIDFNTEQFFFNRKLSNGEMAQMFQYISDKY
ncbi:hypothetical protein UFOVP424_26 [uncultured Caudovirales phage]|uniref:Uncharacterized protein n=1 Tax=uncultured Caudovirales phage TaxID=2100421 RepID=A0A6J5M8T5_9CAUD|nr:hypothetical protein UFOVP424_26 [uncultured Caudovirales phage]